MSDLSKWLSHTAGLPEVNLSHLSGEGDGGPNPLSLEALESLSVTKVAELAHGLNADGARALSIIGTVLHEAGEKRYAEVTGTASAPAETPAP